MISNNIYRGRSLRKAFGILALILLLIGNAGAATWTVDDSGGANFTRIQDAIDNASAMDTILVYSGTYYENVNVNKQLILRGVDNGGGMPIVDAGGNPVAVSLNAGNSTLEGFNAKNSFFYDGISVLSNNNIIKNNNVSNNNNGIFLSPSSTNNTVIGNIANSNREYGIFLFSNNNTVGWNIANSNGHSGISLFSSNDNTINDNIANSNNYYGIFLDFSNSNTLTGNNASLNNILGILLYSSGKNKLMNNVMAENKYNFWLYGESDSHFNNQIDTDNIVNGKKIYYIKNAANTVYSSSTNAGTFYCINCINVTIEDVNLDKNYIGLFFWKTNATRTQNISVSNNFFGIYISSSVGNILNGSNVSNNNYGVYLFSSNSNFLNGNNASNNSYDGIYLYSSNSNILNSNTANQNNVAGINLDYSSNDNIVSGNTANSNAGLGIHLYFSNNNTIFNNYFNNTQNVWTDGYNIWNTTKTPSKNIIGGSYLGGNYWSDYTGNDTDGDGLGDTLIPYNRNFADLSVGDYLPLVLSAANQPPVADFIYSPLNLIVNQTITFDGSPSYDSDGNITNYWWNISGNIFTTKIVNISFPAPGIYYAGLIVTDNDGATNSTAKWINVQGIPSPPAIISWSNNKTNDDSLAITVNESETVRFNATANQILAIWNWYLNNIDQNNNFDNFSYHFASPGNYTLKVNATNANGTSNTIIWNINVQAPPPIQANVIIKPETLNLASKGVFTTFIQLTESYNVVDIDISTVECEGAHAISGNMDGDTYIVKFNREDLKELPTGEAIKMRVTGKVFYKGRYVDFYGYDTIRVMKQGEKKI